MPTADFELVVDIAKGDQMAVILGLHPTEGRQANQCVAVNAKKPISELGFQRLQRILDQYLAFAVAHSDVLLFGMEIVNVIDRHQHQAAAHARTDMLTRFEAGQGCPAACRLRAGGPTRNQKTRSVTG